MIPLVNILLVKMLKHVLRALQHKLCIKSDFQNIRTHRLHLILVIKIRKEYVLRSDPFIPFYLSLLQNHGNFGSGYPLLQKNTSYLTKIIN